MSEDSTLSPEQYIPDLNTNAVWTVRYVVPAGFEIQLALEASSGIEALKKGQAVIERLMEAQCKPAFRQAVFSSSNEQKSPEEVLCPIHRVPMQFWQKDSQSWYAHKIPGGKWCKGARA